MKKLILLTALFFVFGATFAQKPAYEKAMTDLVTQIQSFDYQTGSLIPLANKMERIAAAEKTEWLPQYWMAYCYITENFTKQDNGEKDQLLDIAEKFLKAAEALSPQNDELAVLRANYAQARMAVDPMGRYQTYGEQFSSSLKKATEINPENPRIYYLTGTSLFYTPEQFGGGKDKAKVQFETALEKFANFSPIAAYYPAWGRYEIDYFMGLMK